MTPWYMSVSNYLSSGAQEQAIYLFSLAQEQAVYLSSLAQEQTVQSEIARFRWLVVSLLVAISFCRRPLTRVACHARIHNGDLRNLVKSRRLADPRTSHEAEAPRPRRLLLVVELAPPRTPLRHHCRANLVGNRDTAL